MQTQGNTTYAFIGAGNMASSLVQGLLAAGTEPASIRVADPAAAQLEKLSGLGVGTYGENDAAIAGADVVVLAVKPQVARDVLQALGGLAPQQLLLSVAAGITIASLAQWTSTSQSIVRCMPNTPALLGAGMSALFASANCTDGQREMAENILNAAGETLWVSQEQDLDAVTAVSGSGPAYFFLLMEAMIEAGQSLGLNEQTARKLTLQTAYGAALMANQSDDPPGVLRQNVTSPGGTTEAALRVMSERDLPAAIAAALAAARARAGELALEYGGTIDEA